MCLRIPLKTRGLRRHSRFGRRAQELHTFGLVHWSAMRPQPRVQERVLGWLRLGITAVLLVFAVSCSGMTALQPTAASALPPGPTAAASPVVSQPGREIQGVLGPFDAGAQTCFADLFPCQTFDFSLSQEGPIEVTLTWQGQRPGAVRPVVLAGPLAGSRGCRAARGPVADLLSTPTDGSDGLSDPHRHSRTWSGHSFPIARSILNNPGL